MIQLFRFLSVAFFFVLVTSVSGCYYLRSEPVPEVSTYDLDIDRLRVLARSLPGPRPTEIRLEHVATTSLPGALMMAGKDWDGVEMTHLAFQVLQSDGDFILIDSTQSREMHEGLPGDDPYDDAAWERIVSAMDQASQIVITHEHGDHLGGTAGHPRPETLALNLRLTVEQLANEEALDSIDFPEPLREALVPLDYDDAIAIASGVVLKKAPGHTPGSQMVFVLLEDGQEFLFVGDVVWNLDAITELRYRPRVMTDMIIGENRERAIHQLRALRNLVDQGDVHVVISHDARTIASAAIESGFKLGAD